MDFLFEFYNNIYIVIMYIIILIGIAIVKFRKNDEENSIFSCENLFIMFYYLFLAVAPAYVVLAKNYTYNYNVFFIILMGLICFIIGSSLIIRKKKTKQKKTINFFRIQNIKYEDVKRKATIVLIFSILCALIYLGQNLLYILEDLENNRALAMQGSGIILHFAYAMIPATLILYYCNLHYRKDKKIYIIYIIDIILFLLMGYRSRIIELLFFSIIIRNDYKKFKIKKLMFFGIALVVLVSGLQVVRTFISGGSFNFNIDAIINTMSIGSIALKHIFSVFPHKVPFQYGYTYWLGVSILLPGPGMEATAWLKQALNITFDGGGVIPTIMGEFFINFGFIGIFLGMALMGILARLIDNNAKANNWNKLLYFTLSFYLARSVGSGISNFMIIAIWFYLITFCVFKINLDTIRKISMRVFSTTIMKVLRTRDTVLVASGLNNFDGCPKEIFLQAQKIRSVKNKYFWVTKDIELYYKLKKQYKNVLYSYSIKGFIYIVTSKFYILNVSTQDFYPGLKIPNNRIIIQTFHGFPTKSFCKSANTFYTQKSIQRQIEDSFNPNNMFIITAGKYEDEAFHQNCDFPYERLLKIGHPRNDRLIKHEEIKLSKKKIIVEDMNQKIVCYCPTWRENNNFKLFPFYDSNMEEFNEFLQRNNIVLIIKLHPLYGRMDKKLQNYSNIISYKKEWNIDNIELFSIMDLLITDYSSIYCDYLLTNKPVAFMQYDYEEYIKTRPLSNKREILFPGPNINSFKEFRKEIINLLENENYYKDEREKALRLFYEYYNFDSAKKVIEFIKKIGEIK